MRKNRIKRFFVAVLMLMCVATGAWAQPTRGQLAGMKVGKEGNFRYWSAHSRGLAELKKFVGEVTDLRSNEYVPEQDRIAVFDLDGTLMCETAPYYMHWMAMIYRILDDSTYTPTAEQRNFALQAREMIEKKQRPTDAFVEQVQEVQNSAFEGLTQRQMEAWMRRFMALPCGDFEGLTWGTAFYWPMLEVVDYLVANGFTVYICSGTDRDMIRPLVHGIMPVSRRHVIGSDCHYLPAAKAASMDWQMPAVAESVPFGEVRGQEPVRGKFKQKCTAYNKVDYLMREVGQKPILAFGNSSGDYAMFDFVVKGNPHPTKVFCLLADDPERENDDRNFVEVFRTCMQNGWSTISMNFDWETIYGPNIKPKNSHESLKPRPLPHAPGDKPGQPKR